jgi:DNA-binding IclR family transcriptional regulator
LDCPVLLAYSLFQMAAGALIDKTADGAIKTRSVPALSRALTMLELIAASRNGIALPDIARKLRIPKSTTHCILLTLLRQGYVTRSTRTRRYVFSSKLLQLANQAMDGLRLQEAAAPILRQMSLQTGFSVHMAILEGNEAVLIAKVDPPGAAPLSTWMGRRMELHCTGVGKVLLSSLPHDELRSLLARRVFSRHNENTITSMRRLLKETEAIRSNGYALDDEEDEVGYRCIGVPVLDEQGATVAAISVAGSVNQVSNDNFRQLISVLKRASDAITSALTGDQAGSAE